jgi:hypothetical protein
MAEIHQYDAANALQNNVSEIRRDWQELFDGASSGQKAWFTQMKNHYAIVVADHKQSRTGIAMQ